MIYKHLYFCRIRYIGGGWFGRGFRVLGMDLEARSGSEEGGSRRRGPISLLAGNRRSKFIFFCFHNGIVLTRFVVLPILTRLSRGHWHRGEGKSSGPGTAEIGNGVRKSGRNGAPAPQSRVKPSAIVCCSSLLGVKCQRGVPVQVLQVRATFFIHPQNSARAGLCCAESQ